MPSPSLIGRLLAGSTLLLLATGGCERGEPIPSPTPEGQVAPGAPDDSGFPSPPSKGGDR